MIQTIRPCLTYYASSGILPGKQPGNILLFRLGSRRRRLPNGYYTRFGGADGLWLILYDDNWPEGRHGPEPVHVHVERRICRATYWLGPVRMT